MNAEEYTSLRCPPKRKPLSAKDLVGKTPRTLLFGYTIDRATWHTYFDGRRIITVLYSPFWPIRELEVVQDEDYVPNKRLYVECCDYEFCKLLQDRNIRMTFTTPNFTRESKVFYGDILE